MLATRIKKRPYLFAAWLLTIFLLIAVPLSFFKHLILTYNRPIIFADGKFWIFTSPPELAVPTGYDFSLLNPRRFRPAWEEWRFVFSMPQRPSEYALIIPTGIPTTLLVSLSSWCFWRRLHYPIGHCQSCGYNLQGNTSGTCPECGKAIA
jgi:hypothetical protein